MGISKITRWLSGAFILGAMVIGITSNVKASTGIYVGEEASKDGNIIIANSAKGNSDDTAYISIGKRSNHMPGDCFVEKSTGFVYNYPEETYEYKVISSTSSEGASVIDAATNEYGVSVTVAAGAGTNKKALVADPFVKAGISDESLALIIASSSKTAKQGVNIIASIIDEFGSAKGLCFVVSDQRQSWYMEIYTGHQYAAMKLSKDEIAVFGDEYLLGNIDLESNDFVYSEDLCSLATKKNFAVMDKEENILVGKSYAIVLDEDAKDLYIKHADATLDDVLCGYREGTSFGDINVEDAREVHAFTIYKDVPAEISTVMWACMGNADYLPFVPVSGLVDDVTKEYGTSISPKEYAEDMASCEYKKLNAIAKSDIDHVGKGLANYFNEAQKECIKEVDSLVNGDWLNVYEDDPESAKSVVNEYCNDKMLDSIATVKKLADDALWHVASANEDVFIPKSEEYESALETPDNEEVTESTEEVEEEKSNEPGAKNVSQAKEISKKSTIKIDEISVDEVIDAFETMDPDIKEGIGDLFGVNVDECIDLYKGITKTDTKKEQQENNVQDAYIENYEVPKEVVDVLMDALVAPPDNLTDLANGVVEDISNGIANNVLENDVSSIVENVVNDVVLENITQY